MIRHITELPGLMDNFLKKPWLVLGKGPSIDRIKTIELHNYNVWAINQTLSLIPKADVWACSDYECFTDVPTGMIYQQFFYMQSSPRWRNKGESGDLNSFINHNYVLKMLLQRMGIFSLDFDGEKILFPDKNPFTLDISGAMAFQILGKLGVKEIYSLGLDGGEGRGEVFEGSHKIDGNSYEIHFERVQHWTKELNINWTRL
jgi:hypothetical protein